jgi:hypothetical protein
MFILTSCPFFNCCYISINLNWYSIFFSKSNRASTKKYGEIVSSNCGFENNSSLYYLFHNWLLLPHLHMS